MIKAHISSLHMLWHAGCCCIRICAVRECVQAAIIQDESPRWPHWHDILCERCCKAGFAFFFFCDATLSHLLIFPPEPGACSTLLSLWSDCTAQNLCGCWTLYFKPSQPQLCFPISASPPLCSLVGISFLVAFLFMTEVIFKRCYCLWMSLQCSPRTLGASGSALMTHTVAHCWSACLWQHERQLMGWARPSCPSNHERLKKRLDWLLVIEGALIWLHHLLDTEQNKMFFASVCVYLSNLQTVMWQLSHLCWWCTATVAESPPPPPPSTTPSHSQHIHS